MSVGGFKFKTQNALGEAYETILSDRSSILLVSTIKMFFENYTEETNEINQPLKRESKLTTF